MGLNHYYEDNTLPNQEETIAKINQVELEVKNLSGVVNCDKL